MIRRKSVGVISEDIDFSDSEEVRLLSARIDRSAKKIVQGEISRTRRSFDESSSMLAGSFDDDESGSANTKNWWKSAQVIEDDEEEADEDEGTSELDSLLDFMNSIDKVSLITLPCERLPKPLHFAL